MNATGTIGRPAAHGPRPTTRPHTQLTRNATATITVSRTLNGIKKMELMSETMARSQMSQRLREAESQRASARVVYAARLARRSRRLQRRAERASQRTRRALAMAVMQ